MDQKKIGSFLKALRHEKGMTQEELAEQFYVSTRTVSRWETGNNLPDISLLIEIADFYNVDIREIFDGERKIEKMNEEIKDVASTVAKYATDSNEKIWKRVIIINAICIVCFIASILMLVLPSDDPSPAYGFVNGILLGITAGGPVTTLLYAFGFFKKLSNKKWLRILLKVVSVIIIITVLIIFISSTYFE